MEKREDTPARLSRRKYEERNRDRRRQSNATFGTMIPRKELAEINGFLSANGITKVELVRAGYEALRKAREKDLRRPSCGQ